MTGNLSRNFFQNNNLERALDWIFTHPEEDESDAVSDVADTEPNDNAFSNANSHSDSTLSPDRDATGPRVKDGPGRKLSSYCFCFDFIDLHPTGTSFFLHVLPVLVCFSVFPHPQNMLC